VSGYGGVVSVHQVRFTGAGGAHLIADVQGDADTQTVLFMHGAGQTRHAWRRTATAVAASGWRSVSIDMRGHGESDWASDGDYSFAAFAADCAAVVEQIGAPPVLVGASLGGITAMMAEGGARGEFSAGLVLVDIASHTNPSGVARIRSFMRSGVEGFDSLEEAAQAIAAYTPERRRRSSPDGLRKILRERDDRWYWHWDPEFISVNRTVELNSRPGEFRGVVLRDFTIPTMLVRGLLSDVVTPESVDHLLSLIPGMEVVEVEGAAHMIAGDKNDAFTGAVISFLERRVGHCHDRTVGTAPTTS
jgi:pimeloyl-ACP methyl ester carboxylesterase